MQIAHAVPYCNRESRSHAGLCAGAPRTSTIGHAGSARRVRDRAESARSRRGDRPLTDLADARTLAAARAAQEEDIMLARLQRTQSMIAGTSVRRLLLALNLLASGTGASCVGPKGDKGDPGATGDAGPKGDKGDKGEPGVSCVVAPGDSIQSC